MKLKQKLKIMLITYNRAYYLERTLKQILAYDSPIKDFDITILNNASTDETDDIIKKYQKKFPNLKHIKHRINIGGNANIVRAFELGAQSGKEYVWVLCDDDYYDFSYWNEVKKAIAENADCVGVARYVIPQGQLNNPAYQFFQLTFVPAGIYKTSIITNTVLTNMYDTIYTMFQQSCLAASIINKKKKIFFLQHPIVDNGLHREDKNAPVADCSFTRGSNQDEVLFRRKEQVWVIGFANVVRLLKDKNLQHKCMEVSIPYKDIYGSWENFYNCIKPYQNSAYFFELLAVLPPDIQNKLLSRVKDSVIQYKEFDLNKKVYECSFWELFCSISHVFRKKTKHKRKDTSMFLFSKQHKKTVWSLNKILLKPIKKLSILQYIIVLLLYPYIKLKQKFEDK